MVEENVSQIFLVVEMSVLSVTEKKRKREKKESMSRPLSMSPKDVPKLTKKDLSIYYKNQRERKRWQCEACRQGKKCPCTEKDGVAFIEYPNGKRRWFCHAGCMLTHLSPKVEQMYFWSHLV